MRRSELPKAGKFAVLRNLLIFNITAVIGFILGTVSFTASMLAFANPTFAWLFANCVGGLSHFGTNWVMQGEPKDTIAKNFVVFNCTGIIGFLVSSAMFAVAILVIQNSTAAWLIGSLVGTLSHFCLNYQAMKPKIKGKS
jgi:hypothetical protein